MFRFVTAFLFVITTCFTANAQYTTDLMAGQHMDAGDVSVAIVDDLLTISVDVDGWEVTEWHAYVDATGFPKKAAPGKFPYSGELHPYVQLSAEDVGLASWGDTEKLYLAIHAVVQRVNADGTIQEETAWAKGGTNLKGGWSMGFCVNICEEEYFDEEGFNGSVLNAGDAKIRVQHNGGNPSLPYFTGSVDFDADGIVDVVAPTYCVDLSTVIYSGRDYCAITVASTDERIYELAGINNPENLELANYVLNNFQIGQVMDDGNVLTGGSVQRVMWTLVYGSARNAGEGAWSQDHLDQMLLAAQDNGIGYVPPCTGVAAVVLYPIVCDSDGNEQVAQIVVAQVLISEVPLGCGTRYVICE